MNYVRGTLPRTKKKVWREIYRMTDSNTSSFFLRESTVSTHGKLSFVRQLLVNFPFPFFQVLDLTPWVWYEERKNLLDFCSLHVHILYNLMDPDTGNHSLFRSHSCLPNRSSRDLVVSPNELPWKTYRVWFKKCSSCFRFFSRSLSLLDFFTLSLIFLPVTELLSASSFRFRSFMNFESWTGPEASSVSFLLLFFFLFFSFLFFLFVLSAEESDSEALEELLPVLLDEVLLERFLLFFCFSARMIGIQEHID